MTQHMDELIADLRRLVSQWKDDVAKLEATGDTELVNQIKAWVNEAERIIGSHEGVHA